MSFGDRIRSDDSRGAANGCACRNQFGKLMPDAQRSASPNGKSERRDHADRYNEQSPRPYGSDLASGQLKAEKHDGSAKQRIGATGVTHRVRYPVEPEPSLHRPRIGLRAAQREEPGE